MTFTNGAVDLVLTNPYTIQVRNGSDILSKENCIEKEGLFIISMLNGQYICNNQSAFCNNAFIAFATPPRNFSGRPSLCGVCKGQFRERPSLWIVLGCDVPKNCPSTPNCFTCTDCEKGMQDNGSCCKTRKKYEQGNRRYRKGQMHHYGYQNAKPYGYGTKKHRYAAHANGHENTDKHYGISYFG